MLKYILLLGLLSLNISQAETILEIGASQVGSEYSEGIMLTLSERFNDKYELTFGYISEQKFKPCKRVDCTWYLNEQIFFGGELLLHVPWFKQLTIGVGPYIFQNADRASTSAFRIGASIEWKFSGRDIWLVPDAITFRHFSTADSGPELTLCRDVNTWREAPPGITSSTSEFNCLTNDWNTGQDSWFRFDWHFGN